MQEVSGPEVLQSTVIVTGASSGLGKAIARRLAGGGARVIGTSRTATAGGDIAPMGLTMAALDICCDRSVAAFVQRLADAAIVPDTIILNAGSGIAGAIEATPATVALAQFDTNVIGAHRVVRALLPLLRNRDGGHLIFIGSLAGRIALPFQGFYSASKAALASYAEALRIELRPFGIAVTLIEPGDHCTDFPERRAMPETAAADPYEPLQSRVLAAMVASERAGASPTSLADVVAGIVAPRSRGGHRFKMSSFERMFVVLKAVLPAAWFEAVLRKAYRID